MTFILAAALLLGAAPAAAGVPEGPSVVVLRIPARTGLGEDKAELLTGALTSAVRAQKRFARVVSAQQVEAVLTLEQQRQLMDCGDGSCLAELSGALGADYVLMCTVGRLGASWLVNMALADARTGATAASTSRTIKGDGEDLVAEAFDPVLEILLNDANIGFLTRTDAMRDEGTRSSRGTVDPRASVVERDEEAVEEVAETAEGPSGIRPWHVLTGITAACGLPVPVCLLGSFGAALSLFVAEAARLSYYNSSDRDPFDPVNQAFLAWEFLVGPVAAVMLILPVPWLCAGACAAGVAALVMLFLDRTLWTLSEGLAEKSRVKKYRRRRCVGDECAERRGVQGED